MQTIRVLERTGKDGTLSLRFPLGEPEVEYEVVVVIRRRPANSGQMTWPAGYFESTFGAIDDESFGRPSQGDIPPPVDLDR